MRIPIIAEKVQELVHGQAFYNLFESALNIRMKYGWAEENELKLIRQLDPELLKTNEVNAEKLIPLWIEEYRKRVTGPLLPPEEQELPKAAKKE